MAQRTKTLRYWIESKAVHGETVKSTRTLFIGAMHSFSTFCGLRFVNAGSYRRAHVRIRFANDRYMKIFGKQPNKGPPLGLQFNKGVLYFNSERKVDWEKWVVAAFGHEFGHANRLKHSSSRSRLMHPDLPVTFWHPAEIAWWQKKFTPRVFIPPDLVAALARLPNNSAKKAVLKAHRRWDAAGIDVRI